MILPPTGIAVKGVNSMETGVLVPWFCHIQLSTAVVKAFPVTRMLICVVSIQVLPKSLERSTMTRMSPF
jgi:hypothetical protein